MTEREDLQAKLEHGYRHEKPASCPDFLYNDVLVSCWQSRTERPSFDLLTAAVKNSLVMPIKRGAYHFCAFISYINTEAVLFLATPSVILSVVAVYSQPIATSQHDVIVY